MFKVNGNLMGLLTLNGGIQRGLQVRSRYNFSVIFTDQKKTIKKELCNKVVSQVKKINPIDTLIEKISMFETKQDSC